MFLFHVCKENLVQAFARDVHVIYAVCGLNTPALTQGYLAKRDQVRLYMYIFVKTLKKFKTLNNFIFIKISLNYWVKKEYL